MFQCGSPPSLPAREIDEAEAVYVVSRFNAVARLLCRPGKLMADPLQIEISGVSMR